MYDFSKILNWKILRGSHGFPGPDGGTCINEAAIVAAGLPYRSVRGVSDLPSCFSPPLAAYALSLNDMVFNSRLRQELLLPFVLRLAGSGDRKSVETERGRLILRLTMTDIVADVLAQEGLAGAAQVCRDLETAEDTRSFVTWLVAPGRAGGAWPPDPVLRALDEARMAVPHLWDSPVEAVYHAARAGRMIADYRRRTGGTPGRAAVFRDMAAILGEACRIGKQADPIAVDLIMTRMQEAKRPAPHRGETVPSAA